MKSFVLKFLTKLLISLDPEGKYGLFFFFSDTLCLNGRQYLVYSSPLITDNIFVAVVHINSSLTRKNIFP